MVQIQKRKVSLTAAVETSLVDKNILEGLKKIRCGLLLASMPHKPVCENESLMSQGAAVNLCRFLLNEADVRPAYLEDDR